MEVAPNRNAWRKADIVPREMFRRMGWQRYAWQSTVLVSSDVRTNLGE